MGTHGVQSIERGQKGGRFPPFGIERVFEESMSSQTLFCSHCMKLKDRSDFSKGQLKKKELRVCMECCAAIAAQKAKEKASVGNGDSVTSFEPPAQLFKPLYGAEADKADQMTCLTMHQPWASLLVYGIKRAEGRGWTTGFRGRLWIHAGSAVCSD